MDRWDLNLLDRGLPCIWYQILHTTCQRSVMFFFLTALLILFLSSTNGITWSCSHLYDGGLRKNDVYTIDVDGPMGPKAAIHINCSFDGTAAKTIVHHDQEAGKQEKLSLKKRPVSALVNVV